jgi:XapX domain-containing protein
MKAMLISFAVGLVVGVVYALLRVKSPAPPLVALAGLLGMVWGEQVAARFLTRTPPSTSIGSNRGWRPQDTVDPTSTISKR